MVKVLSIILFGLILFSDYYAQQEIFGNKISGNGDVVSDVFLIRDGFVLDSAVTYNKTYRFEYDQEGKLKRDINFITFTEYTDNGIMKLVPGCRDYFYNERGDPDSIVSVKWNDTLQVFEIDSRYRVTYSYDNERRILSKYYSGTAIYNSVEENSYDSYGNLILNKKISFNDTTYNIREYDSQNRLILKKSIHNSSLAYHQWVYEYDSSGNISCTVEPVGFLDLIRNRLLIFDESDKVINEIHRSFNRTDSTWIESFEIVFNYDEIGRVIKMGEPAWFHYNADGNLDTLVNPSVPINSGYLSNRATLIDSYGNEIGLPDYTNSSYFYYSKLAISDIKDDVIDKTFKLSQNYPNPFNPSTTISYTVSKTSFVSIIVYDVLGREIITLVSEEKVPGNYKVMFNAGKLASGMYIYRMQAGNFVQTKKLILVK